MGLDKLNYLWYNVIMKNNTNMTKDEMKKAFVFDFDDTLATTCCMVRVVRKIDRKLNSEDGQTKLPVEKLTPAEYNDHDLGFNCEYDFSEFRSKHFIRNANPTFLMALAQEVHDEGHSVFILTARSDDVAAAIVSFLAGYSVKPVGVHCVGSDTEKVDIAAEKKKVLDTIAQVFDLVYFYDDSKENCDLAKNVSGVKVYLV